MIKNQIMDIDEIISEGEILRNTIVEKSGRLMSWYEYSDHSAFQLWVQTTSRFLHTHFKGDIKIKEFEDNAADKPSPHNHDILLAILKAFRAIPEAIVVQKDHSDGIVINNANTQSQTQKLVVDVFLEAVGDELTGKQLKELKAALKEEEAGKKGSIIDKLKSFGENTLSNIVANIITNPSIMSNFMG